MQLDRTTTAVTLVCVLGGSALLAVSNLLYPATSVLHVPDFVISLVGKYLCYAILALAVDLVWGYVGILTLGHAAFFALGGYAMGMYLMREIGARGVYANPTLPDFMIFIGWNKLPWYWYGFDHFLFALAMVVLVPGVLAGLFGWFAFRSRVSGVYLSIITQALTYALLLAFFRNDMGFGGNNGMTDFKDILGFPLNRESTSAGLMLITAAVLSSAFLLARAITHSRFGRVLVAVRDADKLVVWVVSAVIAGIGGALYVPQVGIINPSEFAPGNSIEAVIWVAVGGRGTLAGAILGAIIVNLGKTWLTNALPEIWLFAFGGLFILVTLFLPRGIIGLFAARPAIRGAPEAESSAAESAAREVAG